VWVLLLFSVVSTGLWVHRIHVDRPSSHAHLLQADSFVYFHPSIVFLHRELRQGRLPLWNPYQLAGQPYLALHVPAVLYPPNLLFAASLAPVRAMEVNAVFHLVVAGFFSWLLARRLGLGGAARLAAAAGYMFSTALRLGFYMPPFLATPAWLPAILWSLHGLLAEKRGRWAVGLAAFLALAFLGGHTQAFVYELQLACFFGVVGLAPLVRDGGLWRVAGIAGVGALLTLGFVAPQLLPSLELVRQGVRGLEGVTYQQAALSYVTPSALLEGLLRPFGPQPDPPAPGLLRWLVALPPFALPLMACGLLAPHQRRHVVPVAVAAGLVALLMPGFQGPLFETYFSLPLGNLFRNPGRMAFVYALLTSLLVAFGIEGVRHTLRVAMPKRRGLEMLAYVLAIGVAADLYSRSALEHAHPASVAVTAGGDPALVDSLAADPGLERVFLQGFGFYSLASLDKLGMMNGVFAVPDYEPNMPAAYRTYFGVPDAPPWHGRLYAVPGASPRAEAYLAAPRLLDLMSVRHYAIRTPGPPPVLNALERLAGGRSRQFATMRSTERTEAVPRTYVVRHVERVPDLDAALRRIRDAAFRPDAEAVVIDAEADAGAPPRPAAGAGEDRATIRSYAPSEVVIEAECGADCLLVLTDLFYPGWRVTVDGAEQEIEQTNGIFRGVELKAGSHRVVFRFAPPAFRIGTFALCAAALGAVVTWRRT
jgi:hypothetical protein